jgi:hypothetical protein
VNRDQATERIRKLEALADPARGGTAAERLVAEKKALLLRQRFSIKEPVKAKPAARPRTYYGDSLGGVEWAFNIYSGAHSENVTVHHHTSASSWKIEIDPGYGEPAIKRLRRGRI